MTADGEGERWGSISVERASRFVLAWASGPRDKTLAEEVVTATRDRTGASEQITFVTDGWEAYWERGGMRRTRIGRSSSRPTGCA